MAIYNIHAGHGLAGGVGCGAVGILNESTEARKVKDYLIKYMGNLGNTVYDCTYNGNAKANNILKEIVTKCNLHEVDLDISIHLNSGRNDLNGDNSTGGVEVYGYNTDTREVGEKICTKIAEELGYTNRGFKTNKALYVLKNTKAKAILIECCFVDDKDDADKWNAEKCAKAIAEAIAGKSIGVSAIAETSNKYKAGQYVAFSTSYPSPTAICGAQNATAGAGKGKITGIVAGQAKYQINNGERYCNDGDIRGLYEIAAETTDTETKATTQEADAYPIYAIYSGGRWLPEVKGNTDYAGIEDVTATAFMLKMSDNAEVRYRAYAGGRWMGWVNGYNASDFNNGYAGDGKTPIDAIEIKCNKHTLLYKASATGRSTYYPEVSDDSNDNAGVAGKHIDKIMVWKA